MTTSEGSTENKQSIPEPVVLNTKPNSDKLITDEVEKDKSKVDFTKGNVEEFKFYPDNPKSHRHKYKWSMKEPSKFYDPCEESRMASMDCLYRNQDDKYVCQEFSMHTENAERISLERKDKIK